MTILQLRMSKQIGIIIGVLVIALIFGVVAFMKMNKPPTATQTDLNTQTAQSNPTPPASKGTIQSLLAAGQNVTCSISDTQQNSQSTVFVSGNKFRGDFVVQANNQPTSGHILQVDGVSYFWNDGAKIGSKINVEEAKKFAQASGGQTQPNTADLQKEQDMNCVPWNVDQSKFTVPTDIQFTDLSQTLKNLPTKASGAPKVDPSICDQITDPGAKASCIKSLSGN